MRIFITILIICSYYEVWACECVHFLSQIKSNIEYEVEQNDWIGIGTILKANTNSYPAKYDIKIRVLFKGSNQVTSIQTGLGGPDCGFIFEIGEEYIVYGNKVDESTIETNNCRRTNKLHDSADYDYLFREFDDKNTVLEWSESFANFIQSQSGQQIDTLNPPLIINENYQIITIEEVVGKHPNYYEVESIEFDKSEYKKMIEELRVKATRNGILIFKPFHSKIDKGKLIKNLNKEIK